MDFPIKNGDFPVRYVNVYQRVALISDVPASNIPRNPFTISNGFHRNVDISGIWSWYLPKKMPEMDRNAGDIPFSGIPETNISHGVKIHIPHGYFINHKPQLGMVILLGYPRRITRFFDGILPYFYRHQSSMFIPITTRQPPRHSRRTVTAVANWSKNQLRISRPRKKTNRLVTPQWSRCSMSCGNSM